VRDATRQEIEYLKWENQDLKQLVAALTQEPLDLVAPVGKGRRIGCWGCHRC